MTHKYFCKRKQILKLFFNLGSECRSKVTKLNGYKISISLFKTTIASFFFSICNIAFMYNFRFEFIYLLSACYCRMLICWSRLIPMLSSMHISFIKVHKIFEVNKNEMPNATIHVYHRHHYDRLIGDHILKVPKW